MSQQSAITEATAGASKSVCPTALSCFLAEPIKLSNLRSNKSQVKSGSGKYLFFVWVTYLGYEILDRYLAVPIPTDLRLIITAAYSKALFPARTLRNPCWSRDISHLGDQREEALR